MGRRGGRKLQFITLEYAPDVGAQDHGVLGDTVLDDFKGLPDVPVGAGNWFDVKPRLRMTPEM
jgi:hypothetical protein